jgi:hypothetical protein
MLMYDDVYKKKKKSIYCSISINNYYNKMVLFYFFYIFTIFIIGSNYRLGSSAHVFDIHNTPRYRVLSPPTIYSAYMSFSVSLRSLSKHSIKQFNNWLCNLAVVTRCYTVLHSLQTKLTHIKYKLYSNIYLHIIFLN